MLTVDGGRGDTYLTVGHQSIAQNAKSGFRVDDIACILIADASGITEDEGSVALEAGCC